MTKVDADGVVAESFTYEEVRECWHQGKEFYKSPLRRVVGGFWLLKVAPLGDRYDGWGRWRQPMNTKPTIREQVIEWMIDHPGRFTVDRVGDDLGLTRRQTLNALHGILKNLDGLQRLTAGAWEYTPPDIIRLPDWVDTKYDDGRRMRPVAEPVVPLGWRGEMRVVARIGSRRLLAQAIVDGSPTGIYLWLEAVEGPIEFLDGLGR